MHIEIAPGRGRVSVGPPGGPTESIPASVTVTITDIFPYDIEARLEWSPTVGKLAVRKVCCTALPGGDDVSPTGISRIALRDTIQTALVTEYLGGTGWAGLLDKHSEHDPLAVDALIYLLAVAFQSPKPTATVAHRAWSVSGEWTEASPHRSQSWIAPRDRTRQSRRSVTTNRRTLPWEPMYSLSAPP